MNDQKVTEFTRPKSEVKTSGWFLQNQWRLLPFFLMLLDGILLFAALNLSFFIRFGLHLSIFQNEALNSPTYYITLDMFLILFCWITFALLGNYNWHNLLSGLKEYSQIFNGITYMVILILAVAFLTPIFILSRGWLMMTWVLAILFLCIGRFSFRRLIYALRLKGYFLRRTLIIGSNDEAQSLATQLNDRSHSGMAILGFLDNDCQPGKTVIEGYRCLGGLQQLDEIIESQAVEELIVTTSDLSQEQIMAIFRQYGVSRKVSVHLSSGLYEMITTGVEVNVLSGVPLLRVNHVRLTGMESLLKNIMDYTISILLFFPLLLIMAVIGVAIKIDSPGPIFHRRRVLGVNGQPFYALKFRTMYVNGDEILAAYPDLQIELAQNHKLKNDPRVTRVGALLRKTSLDELPQIFNVLAGQMSIVGPRMISPQEIDEYSQWDINLLTVKPGITGLWQVSGRSDVTYKERVRLDMYYIRNYSIWLDIEILLRTFPTVLKRRGAY